MDKVIREVSGCTCQRVRRISRRITQLYDRALAPTGLTINQFSMLANLYGVDRAGSRGLPIGEIADRLGADPTTVNRVLQPLKARGLLKDSTDPRDGRVRLVRITGKGAREFLDAVPHWRRAQAQVETTLGVRAASALNELLDRSADRLERL